MSRSSDYSPETNRKLNARAIEELEMASEEAEDQIARRTKYSQTQVTRQTLKMMTNLSDHIFMLEQRIEDLEIEIKSIQTLVVI